jgi:hypothetical protein
MHVDNEITLTRVPVAITVPMIVSADRNEAQLFIPNGHGGVDIKTAAATSLLHTARDGNIEYRYYAVNDRVYCGRLYLN